MNLGDLKTAPRSLLALSAGFFLLPFWSLTFVNPVSVFLKTGSVAAALYTIVTYWVIPFAIAFLALRKSLVLFPVFMLGCCFLFIHSIANPIAASPYLQSARIVLLVGMAGVGFKLISSEFIFPMLSRNGRRWRRDRRIYMNSRVFVSCLGTNKINVRGMVENVSRSGLLLAVTEESVGDVLRSVKMGDRISVVLALSGDTIEVEGEVMWYDVADPFVRLGIRSFKALPLEAILRRGKSLPAGASISKWQRFWLLNSGRYAAIPLWCALMAGIIAIPNCGTEDGSGFARVGDAPDGKVAKLRLTWDRGQSGVELGLTNAVYYISGLIDSCRSGFTARIDWREDQESVVPIPEGDVGCAFKLIELRIGNEIFLPRSQPFQTAQGATNYFDSALGNALAVINTESITGPAHGHLNVRFQIVETSRIEPIVVKVEIPENACEVVLTDKHGPFAKGQVDFTVRVHPVYLPYARGLTFFPCGESQQWGTCKPDVIESIEYINKFRKKQNKTNQAYMVAAALDVSEPSIRSAAFNQGKSLKCSEYFYLPK